MTKKHFIALADAIKAHNAHQSTKFNESHLDTLARFCKSENSGFDRYRWFSYIKGECGPSGGAIKKAS